MGTCEEEMACNRALSVDRRSRLRVRVGTIARAFVAVATLASCATTKVAPLTDSASGYAAEEDESALIRQAEEYEQKLRAQGLIYEDPELQQYLDGVCRKLVPQAAADRVQFHFAVVREPTINAFSLPQGGIYLHAGLLARLENEAQLAHVVGHEITHTVKRHQLTFVRSLQNKTVAAKVAQMVLVPAAVAFGGGVGGNLVSSVLGLTYVAAVTGYGRENEEEADAEGLKLAAASGYRVQEAPRLFAVLNEVEDPGALQTFFYSDHPANQTRARYTQALLDSGTISIPAQGVTNGEAYQNATRGVAQENIHLRLQKGHYQYALAEAEAGLARRGDDAWLHYYAGEAHRQIAADPEGAAREQVMRHRKEADKALIESLKQRAGEERAAARAAYLRALELDPTLALAHRGIGLVAYQQGDKQTTRDELQAYLRGTQKVTDKRYIEKILAEVAQ